MTIFGVDSSHYDWSRGAMDLAAMARDGIIFATHKVSEGTGYVDPYFAPWAVRARGKFGLLGGYCVNRRGDQKPQVDRYIRTLDQAAPWWRDGDFIVQLDCERWSNKDGVYAWEPRLYEIHEWCDYFMQRTGGRWKPIVYAPKWTYGDSLRGLRYPLWASNYGSNQDLGYRQAYPGDSSSRWAPYSGIVPAVLQFGSRTTIGVQGICDANAFRGSLEQLRALTQGQGGQDDMTPEQANQLAALFHAFIPDPPLRTQGSWTSTGPDGRSRPINPLYNALDQVAEKVEQLPERDAPVLTDEQLALVAGQAADRVIEALRPLLDSVTAAVNLNTRDAIADAEEGGAAAVRADQVQ